MILLAVDTATAEAGVALMRGEEVVGELFWHAPGNHSATLTRALRWLFESSGVPPSALDGIAVSIGPGSFSGVRVGISEAKGLATALDIPVTGVASLDTLALGSVQSAGPLWAALPAGRGRVYLARYEGDWSTMCRTSDYKLLTSVEATAQVGGDVVTGEAAPSIAAGVEGDAPSPTVIPAVRRLRRPGFLAELGRRYFEAGGGDERNVLEPLYLRRSAAEEKRAAALQE